MWRLYNTETTKSLKICYLFNISRIHFKTVHRRTEMMLQQQVSELLWVTWLLNVFMASGVNVHRLRSC